MTEKPSVHEEELLGMLNQLKGDDDAGNAETEDQSKWIENTLQLKKNLGTIHDLRKEMGATVIKKPATAPSVPVVKVATRRKRDVLGSTWHAGGAGGTKRGYDASATDATTSKHNERTLSPTRQRPVDSMEELKTLLVASSSNQVKPGTTTRQAHEKPKDSLGQSGHGRPSRHREDSTIPSRESTSSSAAARSSELSSSRHGPRRKSSGDGLSRSMHGPSSSTTGSASGASSAATKLSVLSSSRHGPRRKSSGDGLSRSMHGSSSSESAKEKQEPTDKRHDPLRSSRHGPAPRRHKSYEEGGVPNLKPKKKDDDGAPQKNYDIIKKEQLTRSRSKSPKREDKKADLLKASRANQTRNHSSATAPSTSSGNDKEGRDKDQTSRATEPRERQKNDPLGSSRHKPRRRDVTSDTSDDDGGQLVPNRSRSRSSGRRGIRGDDKAGKEGSGERSSSRGRRRTKSGVSSSEDDGEIVNDQSTSGEPPRARSTDRGKRRQRKGTKQEIVQENKGLAVSSSAEIYTSEEETSLSGDEKKEAMAMKFSTMSFDDDWDVKPKSTRPILDAEKAKAIIAKEAQEQKGAKRRHKSKDGVRTRKKVEPVAEEEEEEDG